MSKKIGNGTQFEDLPKILGFSEEELECKRARLFPLGKTIDENPTTSIFLASLSAVKEYRELLLSELGFGKIKNQNISLHVFTEIYNKEQSERPDGLIVVTSGKRNPVIEWACFIESKVGNNPIDPEQIDRYIEYAKSIGIKTIISISNEITASPEFIPYTTKKGRSMDLFHWSWTYLKVMSTRLLHTDSVEDEDHVYILTELRRYFEDHKNVNNFTNMGSGWKDAVQIIHEAADSAKLNKEAIETVVGSYVQEEKDISLQLTDNTPYFVHLLAKNGEDRNETLKADLIDRRKMLSSFYVGDDKKNRFDIEVGLIRKDIVCSCQVKIDKGKAQAQTSALLKMLSPAGKAGDIVITAVYKQNKCLAPQSLAFLTQEKEDQEPYSILNKDFGDEVKHYEISLRKELGRDFTGSSNFISVLEDLSETFLNQVVRYVMLGEKA